MRHALLLPATLGLAHAASDCAAGYLLGSLPPGDGIAAPAALLLLYNVLAFGGQLPVGMLLDRIGGARGAVIASLVLMAIACLLGTSGGGLLAVTLAGVASALFHVGGGCLAFDATPGKAGGAGIFAAPGVTGLALGGYLAWSGAPAAVWICAALALMALLLGRWPLPRPVTPAASHAHFDRHDLLMLLLLLAIGMRSAVWNLWNIIQAGDHALLAASAAAAAIGKLSGGLVADRLGWRRVAMVTMLLSAPLLALGEGRPWLFLPGLALLQAATGPVLAMMRSALPGSPATAAGMGLGLGIAAGGIPFLMGAPPGTWLFWAAPLGAGALLAIMKR